VTGSVHDPPVGLEPVGPDNWRDCAEVAVAPGQEAFVAPVTRYLALCAYDEGPWRPYAVRAAGAADRPVVGFVMGGVDDDDGSFWVGGLVIDAGRQRQGYGRGTVEALVALARAGGHDVVRLSYEPRNHAARSLYAALGFVETTERAGDEIVAERRVR
jgi:diamine N-acetyltransferase